MYEVLGEITRLLKLQTIAQRSLTLNLTNWSTNGHRRQEKLSIDPVGKQNFDSNGDQNDNAINRQHSSVQASAFAGRFGKSRGLKGGKKPDPRLLCCCFETVRQGETCHPQK